MENNEIPAVDTPAVEAPAHSPETTALMEAKGWKTNDDVANAYTDLEKMARGDQNTILRIPADDDVDGWSGVYQKLGRPETAEGYKFENKTGIELDKDSITAFNKVALEGNFTQKQYEIGLAAHLDVFKQFEAEGIQTQKDSDAAYEAELKTCDDALTEKWGEDRQDKTVKALELAKELKIFDLIEKKNLGSDPEIVEMLYSLYEMKDNDGLKGSLEQNKQTKDAELAEIVASPEFVNNMLPGHKETHARFLKLMGISG